LKGKEKDNCNASLSALPFKGRVGWGWCVAVGHSPSREAMRINTIPIPAFPLKGKETN
jgi:hypothetical protein